MQTLIKPTIGRIVLVRLAGINTIPPGSHQEHHPEIQPFPAMINFVHSDELINVAGFSQHGTPFSLNGVYLVPAGNDLPVEGNYAYWMPYQTKQAEAHAAAEAQPEEAATTSDAPTSTTAPEEVDSRTPL